MIYSWDTEAVVDTKTGTGWTLDATAANLSTDLDEKDFVVAFNGVISDNSLFTKTSQTSVRYDGVSVGTVTVELRRNTPVAPFRLVNYSDVILSGDYNRNLERYSRLLAEQRAFGGTPPGEVAVVDGVYSTTWAADTLNGASRASLYAKFEAETAAYTALVTGLEDATNSALALRAPLNSPNLTGTPTAPTAPTDTNTTQIATTAYVRSNRTASEATTNTALALKADLASPALTGTPTAPTAAADTDTTQVATTAHVKDVLEVEESTPLTLLNGWVQTTLGTQLPDRVYRYPYTKRARIEANLARSPFSGGGNVVASVPAGYRPKRSVWVPVFHSNGSATTDVAQIETTGNIIVYGTGGQTTANNSDQLIIMIDYPIN